MSEAPSDATAGGVPAFLPPIAVLLLAAALQGTVPLPVLHGATRWIVGGALVLAGLPFGFGAMARMRAAKTSPIPYRPTTTLLVDGPFRFSRNPMYVSMMFFHLGLAVLLGLTLALVLSPFVMLAIHLGSIVPEERHLEAAFPAAFREYRARTRPWL
jgi:protein-S-isoprenylcysteine O-methyltransferase Ste14